MGPEEQKQSTPLASTPAVAGDERENAKRKTDQESVTNVQMDLMSLGRKPDTTRSPNSPFIKKHYD